MSKYLKKQPNKKSKNRSSGKVSHFFFVAFLTVVILAVTVLVYQTIHSGAGTPAIGFGKTQTPPSSEAATTKPTESSATEASAEPTDAPTEEPTEKPTEPTESSPEMEQAQGILDDMTLEEKIYQLFVVTPTTLTGFSGVDSAGPTTQAALEEHPVGGIIYFDENIYGENQLATMISNSQDYSKLPLLICVDEEGGPVSRLSGIGVTDYFDAMGVYGAELDVDRVYEIGTILGEQIGSVGFNVDFAPVADVVTNPNNTEIGNRSFSDDPSVAAEMVEAMVRGLREGGSISCLKHFPGHGSTEADSHLGMSVTHRTLDELRETEFIPFIAGIEAGAEMVMLSHMSAPEVTGSDIPCDLSPVIVTELLREELGFTGVIITDSHEMGAILNYYESGEAALLAIQAGCDIVLMPNDLDDAFETILAAVESGELTEERINESVMRILVMKIRAGLFDTEE